MKRELTHLQKEKLKKVSFGNSIGRSEFRKFYFKSEGVSKEQFPA